jgi:predicted phage terminase large subunit-like protein
VSLTLKPEIQIPAPMDHQRPVLVADARFKVACCGRRWGKTVFGLIACIVGHGPKKRGVVKFKGAMDGGNIWWVAPTYKVASIIWRSLKRSLRGAWVEKNEVDRRIVLPGGGSITVRSADDPDSLRGSGLDGVVIDEAAMMKEESWAEALRPALADRGGWAIFISTPKGMNWYERLFDRAADRPGWRRWQRPSADNPLLLVVNPDTGMNAIEEMRAEMGPLEFAQEIEAQFVVAGRGMFKPEWRRYWRTARDYIPNLGLDALDSVMLMPVEGEDREARHVPVASMRRFATCDIAASLKTSADYTVLSVWGTTHERDLILLDCVRRRMEGPDIVPALTDLHARWRLQYVGIESIGMQLATVQAAIRSGLPAKEIRAPGDKVNRAMTATARCQAGRVFLPAQADWLHDLETEMLSFPLGEHDDFVDTLAYAAIELTSVDMEPAIAPAGIGRESPWSIT